MELVAAWARFVNHTTVVKSVKQDAYLLYRVGMIKSETYRLQTCKF